MTHAHWQYQDEAPEGWELLPEIGMWVSNTYPTCTTWRDTNADDALLLVPTHWDDCPYCGGDDGRCMECDDNGEVILYDFGHAVSKTTALRLKATGQTSAAGLQWWSERR